MLFLTIGRVASLLNDGKTLSYIRNVSEPIICRVINIVVRYIYKALCRMRLLTVLKPAYTFPGGEPRISETIASRAIFIF